MQVQEHLDLSSAMFIGYLLSFRSSPTAKALGPRGAHRTAQ